MTNIAAANLCRADSVNSGSQAEENPNNIVVIAGHLELLRELRPGAASGAVRHGHNVAIFRRGQRRSAEPDRHPQVSPLAKVSFALAFNSAGRSRRCEFWCPATL